MNIKLKVDVTKIDKSMLFTGKKGIYLDCVVWERDQPDEYGNTHSVQQSVTKEQREAGVKGNYIGSGQTMESRGQAPQRGGGQCQAAPPRQQSGQWAGRTGDPMGGNSNYVPPSGGGGGNPEEDDIPFAPLNSIIGGVA